LTIPIKPPSGYKGTVSRYKQKRKHELARERKLVLNRLKAKLASARRRSARICAERINDETWPAEIPPIALKKAEDGGPGFPILPDPRYANLMSMEDMDEPETTPNLQVEILQEDTNHSKRLQMEQDAVVDNSDDDVNNIAATFKKSGGRIVTAAIVDLVVRCDWTWRGLAFAQCKAKVVNEKMPNHEIVLKVNRHDPDSTAAMMMQTFKHDYLVQIVLRLLQFFRQPAPDCGWSS